MVWMVSNAYACPQQRFDLTYDISYDTERVEELYGKERPFYRVNGDSMNPTYHHGDLVVVNYTVPFHEIQLGDVVVFESPADGRTIVHRAIYWNHTHWITIGDNNYIPNEHDVVGLDNHIGVVQGHYDRKGDSDSDYPGVIPQSVAALNRVGLGDCPYAEHPGLDAGWVGLNLTVGWYLVDDTLNPALHRIMLWYNGW